MPTERQTQAYRKRLARRTKAEDLTVECIGAVISFVDVEGDRITGVLTSYRPHHGFGLLGPAVWIDVVVCAACVGQESNGCEDSAPFKLHPIDPIVLHRNEDGVAQVVAGVVAS